MEVRGLVLGTSKHRVGVLTIRGGASWLEVTGCAQDSVGRRSYPGVLTDLAPAD
jgi:hypothetical protein